MSRSFPLLRSNLQALKDSLTHGDSVLWMGWLCLMVASLIGTAFFFLWKGLVSTVVGNIISVLPLHAGEGAKLTINVCLGLSLLLCLLCWAFSMCWIHADQMTFRSGARERLLARSAPLFGAIGRIIGIGLGIGVVGWVLEVAVASRLSSSYASLIVLGAYGVLLLPLTVRLWYLPTIAAVENDNASGPWAMLLQATNGRLIDLGSTVFLQLLLLAVSAYAFKIFVADLASPLYTVATSGDYTTASDYAAAIRSQVSPELLKALGFWILVSGPIVMLVAAMQVATVRFLVGVADEGIEAKESHFLLAEDGTEMLELKKEDERISAADPLKPQFGQFTPPPESEASATVAVTPPPDESRELPDELVRAARGEEAGAIHIPEQPEAPETSPPLAAQPSPASAPTGQFARFSAPPPDPPEPAPPRPLAQEQIGVASRFPSPSGSTAPAKDQDAPPALAPARTPKAPAPPPSEETPVDIPPPHSAPTEEPPRLHPRAGDHEDEIGELPSSPLDRFRKS